MAPPRTLLHASWPGNSSDATTCLRLPKGRISFLIHDTGFTGKRRVAAYHTQTYLIPIRLFLQTGVLFGVYVFGNSHTLIIWTLDPHILWSCRAACGPALILALPGEAEELHREAESRCRLRVDLSCELCLNHKEAVNVCSACRLYVPRQNARRNLPQITGPSHTTEQNALTWVVARPRVPFRESDVSLPIPRHLTLMVWCPLFPGTNTRPPVLTWLT